MRDGYYHTGDVASSDDDGYITYVGRTDDVFKASDYRISPFELESILIEHEAVAEAAVVPSPDPVRLAVPKAYVLLAAGRSPSPELAQSIMAFCRERVAPYKRIRRLEFADLPKTISGKIRRVELRAQETDAPVIAPVAPPNSGKKTSPGKRVRPTAAGRFSESDSLPDRSGQRVTFMCCLRVQRQGPPARRPHQPHRPHCGGPGLGFRFTGGSIVLTLSGRLPHPLNSRSRDGGVDEAWGRWGYWGGSMRSAQRVAADRTAGSPLPGVDVQDGVGQLDDVLVAVLGGARHEIIGLDDRLAASGWAGRGWAGA